MESFHLLVRRVTALLTQRGGLLRSARVQRGFTLIEMTVVLAIIVILTGVILISQTTFNRTLLLTDTAYTVALSIRETQSLGLSSQKSLGVQNAALGVDFSAGKPGSYLQFADIAASAQIPSWCPVGVLSTPTAKPGNCVYDGANELLHTYAFNQGFTQSFCLYVHNGNSVITLGCSNGANGSSALSALDIVFQRPNTDTIMTGTLSSGPYAQPEADTACIEVIAPGGTYRYVKVTQLGEVSVTQTCP